MKLLLTSAGVSNRAIGTALRKLVDKPDVQIKIGFVPTAANVEEGNKDWLINQFINLWRYGFSWIDVVDISAPGVDWPDRLARVDVVYVGGGNTFYLLDQVRKTGFERWLKDNLEQKVYVGGSASSILVTPTTTIARGPGGDRNVPNLTDLTGLGLVDFEIVPHCDAARFESVKAYADRSPNKLYALDDESAVQVVDGSVSVISRGSWKLYE